MVSNAINSVIKKSNNENNPTENKLHFIIDIFKNMPPRFFLKVKSSMQEVVGVELCLYSSFPQQGYSEVMFLSLQNHSDTGLYAPFSWHLLTFPLSR